jgi:cation diffusion facilitator CzcD-associated flavoprotein CzcO
MAIRLRQNGIDDFVVIERADELGGTWRDNSYPGCACDVPSHLYSYSFAPNPDWTRAYSPQAEIWRYLRDCAERFGVIGKVRFGHKLLAAAWDEAEQRWRLDTTRGSFTADVLVSAMGFLAEPATATLPGADRFAGNAFHSSRWDHDYDLSGKRVAVIGTGASALQFVPRIQPRVAQLYVFQRTAPWVLPRRNRRYTTFERRLFHRLPVLRRILRGLIYCQLETLVLGLAGPRRVSLKHFEVVAHLHRRRQVRDRTLRAKLKPNYPLGCKRVLLSREYYPALTQPNVEVVTEPITEVTADAIVTADGRERELDAIIYGTGFHVTDSPSHRLVHGRDGVALADAWRDAGMRAYNGTAVAGFPNFFMLIGPNTVLGHSSMVYMIESQLNYVMECLRHMERRGLATVEVRTDAQAGYCASIDERMRSSVWLAGCASWYLDDHGRNSVMWPGFTFEFRRRTRRLEPSQHIWQPPASDRRPATELQPSSA